ncbi:hypothetical protein CONPUDRAFT_44705 [Coniophora puteana RWD-64-598 SS2]|uniref:Protein kinase domain-containing protein n=1 Tax=Coniophora puteana (strain RWD-64-598) TaxID=741705 RepID=A0A5M3N843_CONPW|nr:uncharacterized protein CONPUDRAFT_44705 [Coniophora puteana RWD-64-598 SS2]EIW87274.1 hypothetical protein CONPUDRAFT_44705 [Coniophora puteana RWD-64-598 SS2]
MSPSPEKNTVLTDDERWWADHYEFLADNGYTLRPRYAPKWVPSWEGSTTEWYNAEDGQPAIVPHRTMDATNQDGKPVCLKRINKRQHPNEESIVNLFSSGERAANHNNHCVPVYEVLPVLNDGDEAILVMPLLRRFADPEFDTVGEAIDFLQQIFDGLGFMHDNGVAHFDCTSTNIMMDGTPMYPEGWHPQQPALKPNYTRRAKYFRRTERAPTYYWVDFAHARTFSDAEALANGEEWVDPDLADPNREAYGDRERGLVDPYAVDVYCLGMFVLRTFIEVRASPPFLRLAASAVLTDIHEQPNKNLNFLVSLVDDMVADDPELRPRSDGAARRLNAICNASRQSRMREPLIPRDKAARNAPKKICATLADWVRSVKYMLTRAPAIPRRPIRG